MSTIDRMRDWVDSTRPHNWYGQCAGLTMSICRHFGELDGGPYPSAYAAYLASGIESTNPRECPPGGIHFWDGYFRGSQGGYDRYGHVAVDITGGGLAVLSATSQAPTFWGRNAGLISVARQTELIRNNPQGRYLGWSRTYGRHKVTALTPAPTPAGGNSTPAPTTPNTTPTTPPAAEIEVLIMSATPFFVKVAKKNGGTKHFLCQPNPLAASNPKVLPFLGFLWSGEMDGFPLLDATDRYVYAYVSQSVAGVNQN